VVVRHHRHRLVPPPPVLSAARTLAVALWFVVAAAITVDAAPADLACNQAPGDRFFWVERAFCDLEMLGPERAQGLVIWNHGIQGTTESWKAPAPPVLRLLQARRWDVIMVKRHHLAETMPGGPLSRTVMRTLDEVAGARKAGYKKIVLAGQSFGGYVTMEAIDAAPDIDAAIAFAS
jgi:pimeloyl-ACP methyl ester carboxylesterase